MRPTTQARALAAGVLLLAGTAARGAEDEQEFFSQPMMEQSIRSAVERSPKDWIAAVVAPAGRTVCVAEAGKDLCRAPVQAVELLASVRAKETPVFDLLGGTPESDKDSRMLVLATPVPGKDTLYGASYLSLDPTPEEIAQFRRALAAVLPPKPAPAP